MPELPHLSGREIIRALEQPRIPGRSPERQPCRDEVRQPRLCRSSPQNGQDRHPRGSAEAGEGGCARFLVLLGSALKRIPLPTRAKPLLLPPPARDLALGPSLFHWESQSTTTAASPTGQRYIHHEARGSRVLLFRARKPADTCGTSPRGLPCRWCHRAVPVSGLCPLREPRGGAADGDSVAAGAAHPGGVDAGDGVGGLSGGNAASGALVASLAAATFCCT